LQAAGHVRAALLRAKAKVPTARDKRRDAGRKEGHDIGRIEGFDAGFEDGKKQAYASAKRELDQANAAQIQRMAESVATILRQLEEQKQQFFVDAEDALAGLAIEIARRAIARELEHSRESLVELSHQVLAEATDATRVKLRVNPMDASAMEARRGDVLGAFSNIEHFEVVEDRSIEFGCRLETDLGLIDGRVQDFLARIVQESREAR
jgi:flagellar biosynthesis/type III secretory pathway protein FliH